jgi:predicted CoA-binding protein
MPNSSLDAIHSFLGVRRIAIAGVSRQKGDYSRIVYDDLRNRGYEVVAVNPAAEAADGISFRPTVDGIAPPPEAAIVLVADSRVLETTRECIRAGVLYVWYRHAEKSSDAYQQAAAEARAAGITVIAGECPLMFLPDGAWIHRAHATVRRWTGSYPC